MGLGAAWVGLGRRAGWCRKLWISLWMKQRWGASRARNPGVNVARVVLATSVLRAGGVLGWTPARQLVPKLGRRHHPNREPTVAAFQRMAVGTSKRAFTLHEVDAQDRPVLRRDLCRAQMARFFANLPPTAVVLEACGGSNHWAAATAADSACARRQRLR